VNKIDPEIFVGADHKHFEKMSALAESRGDDHLAAEYLKLANLLDRCERAELIHCLAPPLADDPPEVWEPTARMARVRAYCKRLGIDYRST
jgi:hypothetical protein